MMEQLVELVVERTGLPEAQARMAVETVIEFIKEKLPDPIANQLDGFLDDDDGLDLGDVIQGLGNLLDRK